MMRTFTRTSDDFEVVFQCDGSAFVLMITKRNKAIDGSNTVARLALREMVIGVDQDATREISGTEYGEISGARYREIAAARYRETAGTEYNGITGSGEDGATQLLRLKTFFSGIHLNLKRICEQLRTETTVIETATGD